MSTLILLRATQVSSHLLVFADALAAASGHRVVLLVDARFIEPVDRYETIPVSRAAIEAMGIYCPGNFAWRCGDYGFYLAQARYPDVGHFWMIEHDVRFSRDRVAAFFAAIARAPEDFLATSLSAADPDWYWHDFAIARDIVPRRCLFPVVRVSARAVIALKDRRQAHARQLFRRLLWPNDEAFVATTLGAGDFLCRDFNAGSAPVYDAASFGFFIAIDGEAFEREPPRGDFRMFHPVLFGEDYRRKCAKLAARRHDARRWKRGSNALLAHFNRLRRW